MYATYGMYIMYAMLATLNGHTENYVLDEHFY